MGTHLSFYHGVWPKELCHYLVFFFWLLYIFQKDPPRSEPSMLGHLHPGWCQGRMFAFISGGACPGFHAFLSNPFLSCPPKINFLSFGFLFCFLALIPRTFSWLPSIPLIWFSIFYFKDTSQAWVWKHFIAGSNTFLVIVVVAWGTLLPSPCLSNVDICLPSFE